jgi:hypothetical protein
MSPVRTLASLGFAVFPCQEDKRPATPHGFKDAVKDPSAVEALWARYPGLLVGVATGEMSGFSVLDIDAKHNAAREFWAEHRAHLLPARVHRTRSGGLHVVYKHRPSLKCSVSKIARGVDVRADGGYIIWWPASGLPVLQDVEPGPWPKWLAVEPTASIVPASNISRRAITGRGQNLRPTLHRTLGIIRSVALAAEGQRNSVLFWATSRTRDMLDSGELDHPSGVQVLQALGQAARRAGLPETEVSRTIASAMRSAA